MIPAGTRVIEFGAGTPAAGALPGPELHATWPRTWSSGDPTRFVCDLNRRPLPDLGPLRPEVAVFAGVLEYVRDVPSVVEWLSRLTSRYCAASYAVAQPVGTGADARRQRRRRTYYGYMNAYSEAELVAVFARSGFACLRTDSWNDQRLFLFEKQPAETRVMTRARIHPGRGARPGRQREGLRARLPGVDVDLVERQVPRPVRGGVRGVLRRRARRRVLERHDGAPPGARWPSASGRATRSSCPP